MASEYNRPQIVEVTVNQRAVVSEYGLLQKFREVPFFTQLHTHPAMVQSQQLSFLVNNCIRSRSGVF